MKKIIISILCVLAGSFINAQDFTGVLTLETENMEAGEKATVKCFIKAPYCKMEINSTSEAGNNTYVLYYDQNNSDMVLVSGGTKTTIAAGSAQQSKYLENILVAIPSNLKQTILGYECTQVKLKTTNATVECMVTNTIQLNLPVALQTGILKGLRENGITGTPLEITVKDLTGKTLITQRVTSVVPQELNDAIFSN